MVHRQIALTGNHPGVLGIVPLVPDKVIDDC